MQYDVFNGDADGICALHQLRLTEPRPTAELVTGVKRDIRLLAKLSGRAKSSDELCVLDISMDPNKEDLSALLGLGCKVFYADHHFPGEIPDHANLDAHIDIASDVCTSLIINSLLGGRYQAWAVVAAFGDNLHAAARKSADLLSLPDRDVEALRELGELINYNGYGGTLADLYFAPQDLYKAVQPFENPLDFFHESAELKKLRNGFKSDMDNALRKEPVKDNFVGRIYMFPAQPWAKRVAGVFSNEKAREKPDAAHGLIVDNGNDSYTISVRSPINKRTGADSLCRAFPTGGGRAAAAGVNALPSEMLDQFIARFYEVFQ